MSKKIAANSQLGQTLIETLVAIFILITALITATSLAYYSLRNNDNSSRQIVGTAIAREAIEGIKNIRDTNWQSTSLSSCSSGSPSQNCYQSWLSLGGSSSTPTLVAGDYAVDFNPTSNSWTVTASPASYELNYNANGNYSNSVGSNPSGYFRKVSVSFNSNAPYSVTMPQMIITATAWWTSRICPAASGTDASLAALPASCKVILVSHLTNWKNY